MLFSAMYGSSYFFTSLTTLCIILKIFTNIICKESENIVKAILLWLLRLSMFLPICQLFVFFTELPIFIFLLVSPGNSIFMLANNENSFYSIGLVLVAGISTENFPPVTTFLFINFFCYCCLTYIFKIFLSVCFGIWEKVLLLPYISIFTYFYSILFHWKI